LITKKVTPTAIDGRRRGMENQPEVYGDSRAEVQGAARTSAAGMTAADLLALLEGHDAVAIVEGNRALALVTVGDCDVALAAAEAWFDGGGFPFIDVGVTR